MTKKKKWDFATVVNLANKCKTAKEFKEKHWMAYKHASTKGWLKHFNYGSETEYIITKQGWRIPYPPKNFIFSLADAD